MVNEERELSLKDLFVPLTRTKAIVTIIVIGIFVYGNILLNGFVWDDLSFIINNPQVYQLNIPVLLGNNMFNNGPFYRPIPAVYFALLYSFFGQSAFFYHFLQLVLHISCTSLLFIFFQRFFGKKMSLFLSLIFLIHPINVESVAYVGSTQSELYFLPGILALLIISRTKLSAKQFILANGFLVLSIFTKETGFIFLLVTVLYAYIFKSANLKRFFFSGLAIGIVYALFRVLVGKVTYVMDQNIISIARLTLSQRIMNIPSVMLYYIKTFFYPSYLAIWQDWVIKIPNFANFVIPLLICLLSFFIVVWTTIYLFKHNRKGFKAYIFFALWLIFGMGLLLHIVPLDMTVADRWFYFPMVGLLGVLGITLELFHFSRNRWFIGIAIIILVLLSYRTYVRSFDWRDELTLASRDNKQGTSVGLENMLSADYFKEGDYARAKIHAQRSVSLNPLSVNYYNLGAASYYLGDYRGTYDAFMNSTKHGNYYKTYESLAFLAINYGDPQVNLVYMKKVSLKKFPNNPKILYYLAALEYNFGNKELAKDYIGHAYRYDQGQEISAAYFAMMNNAPVRIGLTEKLK